MENKQECKLCETKNSHHGAVFKKDLTVRLNRIAGQVKGISRMIEEDVYCDDVLHQISAVESGLNSVKKVLLEAHIKSCVIDQLQEGKVEVVDELLVTLKMMVK